MDPEDMSGREYYEWSQDELTTLRATIEAKDAEIAQWKMLFEQRGNDQAAAEARVKKIDEYLLTMTATGLQEFHAKITRLERELAEAKKDTARLDWLELQSVVEAGYLAVDGAVCTGSPFEWLEENGDTFRAAIDEAGGE